MAVKGEHHIHATKMYLWLYFQCRSKPETTFNIIFNFFITFINIKSWKCQIDKTSFKNTLMELNLF